MSMARRLAVKEEGKWHEWAFIRRFLHYSCGYLELVSRIDHWSEWSSSILTWSDCFYVGSFVEGGNSQHYASPRFLVHFTVCLTSCTKFNRKYEIYKARKQRVRVIYGISLTDVWSSWENIPEQKLEWTFLTPNELLGYPQSFTGWSLAERKRKLGRILPHLTPTWFTFTTKHRA